jgi:hypothetical protein
MQQQEKKETSKQSALLVCLLFNPEDGDNMLIRNFG